MAESIRIAPYAPLSNVLTVIRRLRDRGLPETLSPSELTRIGIPEGNAARTLQALRLIGLVDEEGGRTSTFDRLGRASTTDYPGVLAEIVKAAYDSVLTIIDPETATDLELHDAFRNFEPRAQRDRMVALFVGLCREAALRPGGPVERTVRRPRPTTLSRTGNRVVGIPRTVPTERKPDPTDGLVPFDLVADESPGEGVATRPDYRLLLAMIQQLPKDGKWTQARRDRWLNAMGVNVDLIVEIVPNE